MAATGRQDDPALSARIPFMAAGPSKARTLQAAYMTATVSMPHPPQNSLALACERGPYMTVETLRLSTLTGWEVCPTKPNKSADFQRVDCSDRSTGFQPVISGFPHLNTHRLSRERGP